MAVFTQAFKALSKRPEQTLKEIATMLGVGYSTLQTWIRLTYWHCILYLRFQCQFS